MMAENQKDKREGTGALLAVPNILRTRAERILRAAIRSAYQIQENDRNILQAEMADGSTRYVHLMERREMTEGEINPLTAPEEPEGVKRAKKIKADKKGDDGDIPKKKPRMITRENVAAVADTPRKSTRKKSTKSTSAKK